MKKKTKTKTNPLAESLTKFKNIVPIGDVKPYENNPRINESGVDAVAASISEFGWNQAIVVDSDMVIICGHTRYKAAQKLGLDTIPIFIADHLSETQVKAYRVADNRSSELSAWDTEKLKFEMFELSQLGFSMDIYGFGEAELAEILGETDPVKNGATDPDAMPETPETPLSRYGAVYQLGAHTLACGDATKAEDVDRLMGFVPADLWVTDPPYNVDIGEKNRQLDKTDTGNRGKTGDIKNDKMSDSSFREFLKVSFSQVSARMKPGASFYIFHADSEGYNFRGACHDVELKVRQCLVWKKNVFVIGRQDYQWIHETCLYGWKSGASHSWCGSRSLKTVIELEGQPFTEQADGRWQFKTGGKIYTIKPEAVCEEEITTVLDFKRPTKSTLHPTMKPVEMLVYLIKNSSQRGNVVVDTFAGSGSTLIACEQTGRVCNAMELDPRFCDVIRKRWAEFTHGEGCDWQANTPECGNE